MLGHDIKVPNQIPDEAHKAASRLGDRLGAYLVSVIFYPEKSYRGGLVVLFRDDAEPFVDLITDAFKCVPLDIFLHCIRRGELPELCLPAFTWLHVLNRHIQLPYLIKHHGIVLYGIDVRDEMPALPEPRVLFQAHLESCAHFMRNHAVLRLLASGKYLELIKRVDWQIKCLMSTALLIRGEWDGPFDSIPARFEAAYHDEQLKNFWRELGELRMSLDAQDESSCRRASYEAVWLFECFLRRLREYVK